MNGINVYNFNIETVYIGITEDKKVGQLTDSINMT